MHWWLIFAKQSFWIEHWDINWCWRQRNATEITDADHSERPMIYIGHIIYWPLNWCQTSDVPKMQAWPKWEIERYRKSHKYSRVNCFIFAFIYICILARWPTIFLCIKTYVICIMNLMRPNSRPLFVYCFNTVKILKCSHLPNSLWTFSSTSSYRYF